MLPLLTALAMGQSPAAPAPDQGRNPGQEPQTGAPGRYSVREWSEAESRRLFQACDGNGDDRLDLFESASALETLGNPRDRDTFRRFDTDRDGYLTFPEFDGHFREVTQRGDTLRVRTCRPLPPLRGPVRAPVRSPAEHLLDLFDKDGNGDLRDAELEALIGGLGLPPAFVTVLRSLDKDNSGGIGERELAGALQALPGGLPGGLTGNAAVGPATAPPVLPTPWGEIDVDRDGKVGAPELARSLRQIDAELARWAPQILQAADRNRDQVLEPTELGTTPAAGTKAPAPAVAEPRSRS